MLSSFSFVFFIIIIIIIIIIFFFFFFLYHLGAAPAKASAPLEEHGGRKDHHDGQQQLEHRQRREPRHVQHLHPVSKTDKEDDKRQTETHRLLDRGGGNTRRYFVGSLVVFGHNAKTAQVFGSRVQKGLQVHARARDAQRHVDQHGVNTDIFEARAHGTASVCEYRHTSSQ